MADLELRLSPRHDQSRDLRDTVRAWCSNEGYPESYVDDVVLVASELFSNAVRATVSDSWIVAAVERRFDKALVRMTNEGTGFDPDELVDPNVNIGGGRGIWLAKALGELGVTQRHTQTIVTVVLH